MHSPIHKSILPSCHRKTLHQTWPELQLALVFHARVVDVHGRHGIEGIASVAAGGMIAGVLGKARTRLGDVQVHQNLEPASTLVATGALRMVGFVDVDKLAQHVKLVRQLGH